MATSTAATQAVTRRGIPPTWLAYYGLLALGIAISMRGPSFPTLGTTWGVTTDEIAQVTIAAAAGYIIGNLIAGYVADRIGRRIVMVAAFVVTGIGLLLLPLTPTLTMGFVVLLITGIGTGLLDTGSNVLMSDLATEKAGAALNLLHVFFGVGALMGPLMVAASLNITGGILATYVVGVVLMALGVVFMLITHLPTHVTEATQTTIRGLPTGLPIILICIGFFAYVGAEFPLGDWLFTAISINLQGEAGFAAFVNSGFWLGLMAGRLVGFGLLQRLHEIRLMWLSIAASLVCAIGLVVFSGNAVMVGIFALAIGVAFGPYFPTMLVVAQRYYPNRVGMVSSLATSVGGLGALFLPYISGRLLAQGGTTGTFGLFAAILGASVAMLVLYAWLLRFPMPKSEN